MATSIQHTRFNIMKHQGWEDGASMILGLLVIFSPWLSNVSTNTAMMTTTGFVGFVIIAMAGLETVSLRRWEETIECLCGAWLFASPFVFDYAGALRFWHFALGALVIVLALLELRQDWDRKLTA